MHQELKLKELKQLLPGKIFLSAPLQCWGFKNSSGLKNIKKYSKFDSVFNYIN